MERDLYESERGATWVEYTSAMGAACMPFQAQRVFAIDNLGTTLSSYSTAITRAVAAGNPWGLVFKSARAYKLGAYTAYVVVQYGRRTTYDPAIEYDFWQTSEEQTRRIYIGEDGAKLESGAPYPDPDTNKPAIAYEPMAVVNLFFQHTFSYDPVLKHQDHIGRVNDSTFAGYPAGTVRFCGVTPTDSYMIRTDRLFDSKVHYAFCPTGWYRWAVVDGLVTKKDDERALFRELI